MVRNQSKVLLTLGMALYITSIQLFEAVLLFADQDMLILLFLWYVGVGCVVSSVVLFKTLF